MTLHGQNDIKFLFTDTVVMWVSEFGNCTYIA